MQDNEDPVPAPAVATAAGNFQLMRQVLAELNSLLAHMKGAGK